MRRWPAAIAAAWLFAVVPASAADITKGQCIEANTAGQTLRKEGKLSAAASQLQVCSDPKCPEILRADCQQRLEELEAAYPSILFDVKDAAGHDVADVKVTVDGKPFVDKLSGSPMRIDPGSHEITFEIANEKPLTRTFVLKEGEKLRKERISFGAEAPPPPPPPPANPPPPPPKQESSGTAELQRYGGLGLAAAGVVAIGVGAFYGVKAIGKASDQEKSCKSASDCRNYPQALSDHDGAEVWGRFSTIGFIAGSVLLVGGAVLFFTAPKSSDSALKKVLPLAQAATTGWAF
ncbi:MAG: hypothetical protein KIT84_36590 [Labilithrix sp.]|nr:hypothetical protein [Labilithrix sp.]MCW5816575.1 hypothetical protein [Labilithrix sp.]